VEIPYSKLLAFDLFEANDFLAEIFDGHLFLVIIIFVTKRRVEKWI
jgi:hypothetical protein